MGANIENVDAPSVSQADVLRQDILDPSGLQYDLPSISNHTYSNMNTSQPSTMENPQGNNQMHTLSHISNLMVSYLFFISHTPMCQNLDLRFLLLYCLFVRVFLLLFIRIFLLFFGLVFYCLSAFFGFFIALCFPSSFFSLVLSLFFVSCGFISTLPQLAWD
jgi:hypothetical protein